MLGAILGGAASGLISGAFNSRSADKQMEFQERMSNTSYQRAAADLEKAGLNRILALGNGATTPSGASASINMPDLGTVGVNAANSTSARSLQRAQEALAEKQWTVADAQERKVEAEILGVMNDNVTKKYNAIAAMNWADQQAEANVLLTRAQEGLAVNNSRSAGIEADFQEARSKGAGIDESALDAGWVFTIGGGQIGQSQWNHLWLRVRPLNHCRR